jgi:hypothetical protein
MTAVRFRDGARYGLRLYGYVLGLTIFGGAGIGLGAALAWPEVQAWLGRGAPDQVVGAGGAVLLFLGVSILAIGYFGLAYKLIADGVAAGSTSTSAPESGTAVGDTATDAVTEPATADPNGGEGPPAKPAAGKGRGTGARSHPSGADPSAGTATDSGSTDEPKAETQRETPREPSPEEIAFGNPASADDDTASEPETSPVEESRSESSSGTVATQNASADPLADPTDEE